MTGPEISAPPRSSRRAWLVGVAVAWIVVVAALGVWSVWRDPATVPEQRDIVAAVGDLRRATGVVFAAADGDGRAVVLGGLDVVRGCRITPVRDGVSAARDVTVYVRDGEARGALTAIATALPGGYRADVADSRGGTRMSLHADAGNFIGVDSDAEATAKVLTLRVSTGCRPPGAGQPVRTDPPAGTPPAALDAALRGLGASGSAATALRADATQAVICPDGGVAATFAANGPVQPADMADRLRAVSAGGSIVRDDSTAWAYRTGSDSVVVVPDGKRLRVLASIGCGSR